MWSWGEFSVVLGAMQRVKVPDKVMNYITLFCSNHGCYPHFVDLHVPWILSAFCGYYLNFMDSAQTGVPVKHSTQSISQRM